MAIATLMDNYLHMYVFVNETNKIFHKNREQLNTFIRKTVHKNVL